MSFGDPDGKWIARPKSTGMLKGLICGLKKLKRDLEIRCWNSEQKFYLGQDS